MSFSEIRGTTRVFGQDCPIYEYSALENDIDSIRVLNLLPGEKDSPLHIELQVVPFSDTSLPVNYEALSYTWGSQTNAAYVNVDSQVLPITRNLEEALLHLRWQDKRRALWIDALCINQSNLEEKGPQVSRIAEIFQEARRVIAWVGPEADDSAVAIDTFTLINAHIGVDRMSWTLQPQSEDVNWADLQTPFPFSDKQIDALCDFMHRPWFERMWVWPEVHSMADYTNLVCGERTISWTVFSNAFACLYVKAKPNVPKTAILFRRLVDLAGLCLLSSFSFLGALQATRACKCSDPRDRVYAVKALVDRKLRLFELTPDYSRTSTEVYLSAASSFITASGNLDILQYTAKSNDMQDLPSWCPDWSASNATKPFANRASTVVRSFHYYNGDESLHLHAKGMLVSRVIALEPFDYDIGMSSYTNALQVAMRDFLRRIFERITGSIKGEDISLLCRILGANDFYETRKNTDSTKATLQEATTVVSDLVSVGHTTAPFVRKVLRPMCTYSRGRAFFKSEAGHLGLVRADAVPGDLIAVLIGCNAAIALRPNGDGSHSVVGDAYCDGVMHGEMILGPLPADYDMMYKRDDSNNLYSLSTFRNRGTEQIELEDPRLGDLPAGWQRVQLEGLESTPAYQHAGTGEMRYDFNDPRLDLDVLEAQGIHFENFDLV